MSRTASTNMIEQNSKSVLQESRLTCSPKGSLSSTQLEYEFAKDLKYEEERVGNGFLF